MAAGVQETVRDSIVQALRATGDFALVTAGERGDEAAVPRAHVLYQGRDEFAPDDAADTRWLRLRFRVRIHTLADDAAGEARLSELAESAVAAIRNDAYRGGVCADLPLGRATEANRLEVLTQLRRPEAGIAFEVRCHVEES